MWIRAINMPAAPASAFWRSPRSGLIGKGSNGSSRKFKLRHHRTAGSGPPAHYRTVSTFLADAAVLEPVSSAMKAGMASRATRQARAGRIPFATTRPRLR